MSQNAPLTNDETTKFVADDDRMRDLFTDYLARTVYDQIRATQR